MAMCPLQKSYFRSFNPSPEKPLKTLIKVQNSCLGKNIFMLACSTQAAKGAGLYPANMGQFPLNNFNSMIYILNTLGHF